MLNLVQMVPLVVFIPAIGAIINLFWGAKLGVKGSGYVASGAAILTFIISVLLYSYLTANHGIAQVVDPLPFFDGWIRIDAVDFAVHIPWQFRVDSLTVVMLLVVTGVGSLIHIYSIGYISHDPKYGLFFAYLNMFLGFMLILVTSNNFLMMFVGWEGVGVMSFLLIGFWWDKKGEIGWQNGNAARKAMILNRIGDFGILMAIFLMFWTFGTVTYYDAGEVANTCFQLEGAGYTLPTECESEGHGEEASGEETEAASVEEGEAEHAETGSAAEEEHATGEEGEAEHGLVLSEEELDNSLFYPSQLGVFAQAERLLNLEDGEEIAWDADGNMRGRDVQLGTWTLDIKTVVTMIVLFLLLGAAGKSAQFPLLVWLPDAMAGPTPVSALMHAATMVTAGVYLLVRSNVLIDGAPEAQFIIAMVGAITALFGGIAAVGQWDIKRVLAFSTISQLGFMVAAIGVGGYVAAIFHLATHAVFKALLFLGSGSVIHGVEHGQHHVHEYGRGHDADDEHHDDEFDPQDMRNMGGLSRRMPVTYITYLMGMLALSGIPIFAGFWSKDEILAHAYERLSTGNTLESLGGIIVLATLLLAAGFTAFYMWRQMEMVFFGKARSKAASHAPESVGWMVIPLLILAIGSIFVGFINVPSGVGLSWLFPLHNFTNFLESSIPSITIEGAGGFIWLLAIVATGLAVGAIFLARSLYGHGKAIVAHDSDALGVDPLWNMGGMTRMLWSAASHRLYLDDLYHAVFLYPYERIGYFLAVVLDWRFFHDYFHNNVIHRGFNAIGTILKNPVDIGLIDGTVNGVGKLINWFSGRTRRIQTGFVRTYAIAILFGVVVVIILMVAPVFMNGS
ncbi:MAG: proton-conducting transporter membrane subunit [Anaerolineae bacterium]|nr:proton-conducting transporter membrane subunit [Anaerolineae bacterium]MDQ7035252.1 proton-conducting transporter membrane subunit [Anaerolineae bacterium]